MSDAKPIINREIWEQLRALETADNPGFFVALLETFLSSIPRGLTELERAAASGDFRALSQVSHSLKSSCTSIGALQAAAKLETIEHVSRSQSPSVSPQLIESATFELKAVAALVDRERVKLATRNA